MRWAIPSIGLLLLPGAAVACDFRDFDFLLGKKWKVHNEVLEERLVGSTDWKEFEAVLVDARTIVNGLGNVDSFQAVLDGKRFEGNSIRLFDAKTNEWVIYWVDSKNPELRLQVRGKFEGGVGEFHGEEVYRGQTVRMRFLWKDISENSARWEQAYLDETTGEWETNWIMEFTVDPASH